MRIRAVPGNGLTLEEVYYEDYGDREIDGEMDKEIDGRMGKEKEKRVIGKKRGERIIQRFEGKTSISK